MREKYCWLAGGWKLVLKRCEKKMLLGWRLLELPNRVILILILVHTAGSNQGRYRKSEWYTNIADNTSLEGDR